MTSESQLCVFSNLPPLKPAGALITSPRERALISKRLSELYGAPLRGFPGSQPVSIEGGDIPRLREHTFMVGLKTDGVRFLLLLLMMDAEPRAIMINRKMEMHEIESVWAPLSYFEEGGGTLLDGELVWEQQPGNELSQLFLIFDIVAARGRLTHLTFSERLTRVHRHVLSELPARMSPEDANVEALLEDEDKMYLSAHNLRMAPKRFVPFAAASELWAQRRLCVWKNDGLIFMRDDASLQTGTDRTAYKWKPVNSISVDVLTNSNHEVVVRQHGEPRLLKSVDVFGVRRRVLLEDTGLLRCIGPTECVLECTCAVDDETVTFTPIKCRADKVAANDLHTVVKTLENVIEAIDVDRLFGAADAPEARRRRKRDRE